MQTDLTTIGVLLAVMLALTEVIKLLVQKSIGKKNGQNGFDINRLIRKMSEESTELYRLHSKTDENGKPIWYVKQSTERAIKDLNIKVSELEKQLNRFYENQKEIKKETDSIHDDIHELLLRSRIKVKPGSAEYQKIINKDK